MIQGQGIIKSIRVLEVCYAVNAAGYEHKPETNIPITICQLIFLHSMCGLRFKC